MNFKLRNSDVDILGTFFSILVKQMTAHSRLWSLNFTEIFSKSNHDPLGVETHRKTMLFEPKSWCIVVLYLLLSCGNPHILLQSIVCEILFVHKNNPNIGRYLIKYTLIPLREAWPHTEHLLMILYCRARHSNYPGNALRIQPARTQ